MKHHYFVDGILAWQVWLFHSHMVYVLWFEKVEKSKGVIKSGAITGHDVN